MNYEPREKLCNPACALGKNFWGADIRISKGTLIRKYGEEFYNALDRAAKMHHQKEESK